MARFRRAMALRPVHRIKHVVDSAVTLAAATNLETVLVLGVDAPVKANTAEVETASTVHGIFLNIQIASNETEDVGAIPQVYMALYKNNAGNIDPALNPASLGQSKNKKFVIHQDMVMIENSKGGNPKTLFKGVITIPRGYKRFGIDDELVLVTRSTALDIVQCVQCIYKEFR